MRQGPYSGISDVVVNEDEKSFLLVRLLGCLGGLIGGCIGGTLLVILLIIVTNSTFGLNTIWPGTFVGALIGALLGFLSPRIGKLLFKTFTQA